MFQNYLMASPLHTIHASLLLVFLASGSDSWNVPDSETQDKTLTLGLLSPFSHEWDLGRNIASTIIPAIERVQQLQLLPDYEIKWTWRDSGCTPYLGKVHYLLTSYSCCLIARSSGPGGTVVVTNT